MESKKNFRGKVKGKGLQLRRKKGESIIINDSTKISISRLNGSVVQLTICAPNHVYVDREEIYVSNNFNHMKK